MARKAPGRTERDAEAPLDAEFGHEWSKFRPRPPLDIDRTVDVICSKTRPVRIREDFTGDPFKAVRSYIGLAILQGLDSKRKEEAIRQHRAELSASLQEAKALQKGLSKFASKFSPGAAARPQLRGFARANDPADNEWSERMAKAKQALLADPLNDIVEGLRRALDAMPKLQASADVFSTAFAEMMGYGWKDLTGRDPDHGDRFMKFVIKAHAAVAEIEWPINHTFYIPAVDRDVVARKVNWRVPIANALKRVAARPEWDRWDRYERGSYPPGTQFDERTAEERTAWRTARAAEADAEMEQVKAIRKRGNKKSS